MLLSEIVPPPTGEIYVCHAPSGFCLILDSTGAFSRTLYGKPLAELELGVEPFNDHHWRGAGAHEIAAFNWESTPREAQMITAEDVGTLESLGLQGSAEHSVDAS